LDSESRRAIDLRKEVVPFLEKLRTSHFDAETLHEVRLELKHVRYAAEAAGDVGFEMVAILKPVQDAIGEWHDWWNLVETADHVLGPLPGHPLMTILRSKMRGRFTVALAALKPLQARLSTIIDVGEQKRSGPVLVRPELVAAANAG
jgi:CHAD domain-containing protein